MTFRILRNRPCISPTILLLLASVHHAAVIINYNAVGVGLYLEIHTAHSSTTSKSKNTSCGSKTTVTAASAQQDTLPPTPSSQWIPTTGFAVSEAVRHAGCQADLIASRVPPCPSSSAVAAAAAAAAAAYPAQPLPLVCYVAVGTRAPASPYHPGRQTTASVPAAAAVPLVSLVSLLQATEEEEEEAAAATNQQCTAGRWRRRSPPAVLSGCDYCLLGEVGRLFRR
jgi:hypothetical protein